MDEVLEVEGKRRGRPPKSAAAEEVEKPRMIEVELIRKYVPHLCYELSDGKVVPVLDPDGNYLRQDKVTVGETRDKFNRVVPKYREIFEAWPAGTKLSLPADEAGRVLKLNIGRVTEHTFG